MDGGQKEVKTEPSPLVCQGDTARDGSRSGGETRGEGDRVKTQENTGARSVIDEAFCVLCAERQTSTPEELLEKPGPNEELRIPCAVAFSRLLAPPEEGSSRSLGTTSTPLHAILAISWCGSNSSARELLRAVLIGAGCCLFACTDVEGFYFCRSSGCFSELLRSILALQPYLPRLVRQGEEKKVSADAATQCMVKRADPVGLMEKGVEGHTVRQFVWGAVRELGGVACAPPFSKKQRAAWRSVMKKQIFQDADIRCLSAAIAAASASSEGQWLYVSRAAWLRQACAVQRGLHFAPGIEHASLRSCQLLRDGVELVRNVLTADAVASLYSMIMKHFELLMDRVLPVHREWPFSPPNSSLFKYNGIACRNSTMRVDVNLSEAHWEWGEGELRRRHLELQRQVLFLTRLAAAHIAQRFGTWRRGPRQAGGSSPMLYTSAGASSERSENDSCSARAVSEGCTPDAASAGGTAGGCAEPDSSLPEKSEKNETENECESQGSCDEKAEGKIPEEGVWRAITFGYIISIGPHSNDQKVHHDYHQEAYERNILNAFFPLVDITPDNSATTFLICGKKLLSCAGAGDMILMDNVVRHYGSSHVASTIRPLIYCSLADRRTTDTREPVGKKTHFYNWHQYPPLPSPCRSTAPETTPQVSRADKTANRRPQRVVFETLQDTQEETARRCFENGASAKTTGSTERQHGHQQESGRAGVGIERLRGQDWSSGAELDSPRSASHTTVLAGISRTLGENEESPGEKQESDESASLVSYAVQLLESNTSCHRGPECGDQRTPYAAKESARIRYMCPAAVKGSMDNGEAYTSEEKGRTFPSPGRENQPVGRLGDRNGGWEEMRDSSRCDERNFSRARNGAVGAEEGSLAGGFTRQVGGDGSEGEPHTPSSSGCTASNTGEGPTGSDAEKKASEVERGEGDPVVVSEETERQRAAGKEKSDAAAKAAEASRPVAHAGPGEQSTGGLPLYLRHVLLYRKHVATCGGASRKKAAV
ncbi:hypothetical protein CSUI_003670 [Cystoisospora suis]|uniref:Uncharacterized protein n=1 Tax=Cystoisospora suis TaxID=483139 RepID=A0A2C6L4K0_9APIC|nr:hypothetical protein CSUI_003670 [Cystoisospora suis]